MKKPFVSVAMATYNGERFIEQQLASILEQTRPVDEIVVSDDASTDDTVAIIKRFMKMSGKIQLVTSQTNAGLNANFEKALSKCMGDFITISDQDNIWMRDRIEKLLAAFNDELLVYSDSWLITENGHRTGRLSMKKKYRFTDGTSPKEFYFYNAVFGHTVMFRRQLIDAAIPFPESGINYDGWLAFTASCIGRIRYVDEALSCFRIHSGNITHRHVPGGSDQRRRSKLARKRSYQDQIIQRLTTFLGFNQIPRRERVFLDAFRNELLRSERLLFNIKLFMTLLFHQQSLLHMKSRYKTFKKCFNQSVGLEFYRYLSLISFRRR